MISDREVHLHTVWVEDCEYSRRFAVDLLSREEQEEFAGMRRHDVSRRAVLNRAVIRKLLGRYVTEVRFEYGLYGKPRLVEGDGVKFSVSHSGKALVLAVTRETEVGVDVEQVRPIGRADGIARRFFRAEEAEEIERSGEDAFLRCWTQKEAVVKALGLGVSCGLNWFRVAVGGGVEWMEGEDAGRWQVVCWRPLEGHLGALAYRDAVKAIRVMNVVGSDEVLRA